MGLGLWSHSHSHAPLAGAWDWPDVSIGFRTCSYMVVPGLHSQFQFLKGGLQGRLLLLAGVIFFFFFLWDCVRLSPRRMLILCHTHPRGSPAWTYLYIKEAWGDWITSRTCVGLCGKMGRQRSLRREWREAHFLCSSFYCICNWRLAPLTLWHQSLPQA